MNKSKWGQVGIFQTIAKRQWKVYLHPDLYKMYKKSCQNGN